MSDENNLPEKPSPSPAELQPTPANEPIPPNQAPAKAGITEKVRAAAARVIGQAGFTFTKGRGRPKKCVECDGIGCDSCGYTGKMPGKLDRPMPAEAPELPPADFQRITVVDAPALPAGPDTSVSALFRRSCVASVKGVLGILKGIVGAYASAAGIAPAFTAKALAKADPDHEALADFTESLDVVLKKHNVQPKHAEEWALAINGARLVAPYALLIAEFKAEIHRNRFSHADREAEKSALRDKIRSDLLTEFKAKAEKDAGGFSIAD